MQYPETQDFLLLNILQNHMSKHMIWEATIGKEYIVHRWYLTDWINLNIKVWQKFQQCLEQNANSTKNPVMYLIRAHFKKIRVGIQIIRIISVKMLS